MVQPPLQLQSAGRLSAAHRDRMSNRSGLGAVSPVSDGARVRLCAASFGRFRRLAPGSQWALGLRSLEPGSYQVGLTGSLQRAPGDAETSRHISS
jgi:hypothetical protein